MVSIPKAVPQIIILVILLFALLFVLVNFGYIRPCDIPGFDKIYYGIRGYPQVAILSGTDGSGDPEALRTLIVTEAHIFPTVLPIEYVYDSGALSPYGIVIVEHAKTMPTQTLNALQQYVSRGGKLVWIGDAGSALGPNDYICEKVEWAYKVARNYTSNSSGTNVSAYQCSDWITKAPDVPESVASGLCGRNFGEIVSEYLSQNKSISDAALTGDFYFCPDEQKPFQTRGDERIKDCFATLAAKGENASNASAVNEYCYYNYWNRGPSKTATGEIVPAIDFSGLVLGFDYVSNNASVGPQAEGEYNIFLQPVDPTHTLIRGYETSTAWAGVANVTFVSTARFAALPRSYTIMSIKIGTTSWPAIIVSNPTLAPLKRGLVTYYAFPIDELYKIGQEGGRGLRLINNLFDYEMCA